MLHNMYGDNMLNERLKELRKEKRLSQEDMANLLGISRQAYGHYELNLRQISLDALTFLAGYFNVSSDYLLGLTDDPTPPGERAAAKIQNDGSYSDLTAEQIEKIKSYEAFLRTEQANIDKK